MNKFKDITDEQLKHFLIINARRVGQEQFTRLVITEIFKRLTLNNK